MKATQLNGSLNTLNDRCKIDIPGYPSIQLKILPEMSDRKGARYSDETVIGRSMPMKSYSYSDNRNISLKVQLLSLNEAELQENKQIYYAIASLTYPRAGSQVYGPYAPPPVCKLRCGDLIGSGSLSVILDNYDLNIPTDVVWDDKTLIPYYFTISTSWTVVYPAGRLPNQETIIWDGIL